MPADRTTTPDKALAKIPANTPADTAGRWQRDLSQPQITGRAKTLMRRGAMALCLPVFLAGCLSSNSLAFAPTNDATEGRQFNKGRALTAVFGEGKLVLAAPAGFCFDSQLESHTDTGGFALMARCERLSAFGRLRAPEGIVLTATIGRVAENTPTPSAEALKEAYTASRSAARVLETRKDSDIPLVKLFTTSQSAAGASGTHWRGAFVVRGHLVSVALYAPDGSQYLGDKGARVIREFMRATRNATHLSKVTTPPAPTDTTQGEFLRPKARPGSAGRQISTKTVSKSGQRAPAG